MIDDSLIYDVGAHKGEDTEFYLRKGFRVIAIEANPEFCGIIKDRLPGFEGTGALTVLNLAVSNRTEDIEFFVDKTISVFGNHEPRLGRAQQRHGIWQSPNAGREVCSTG